MTAPPGGETADIWVVSDGKAGHRNQSLGLAEALLRQRPAARIAEVPATPGLRTLLAACLPARRETPGPALLIGAGHGTHASLLRWRRRLAARTIVLMRPSLPRALFDLCIEPRHDGGAESERRWLTDGPLNRMRPAATKRDPGIILIGGPSPHFHWDSDALLTQLARICSGDRAWVLSTSRRTPSEFLPCVQGLALPGLVCHDCRALPGDWLAATLPGAAHCWVSPDSASMVYEALTAGCAVGVFDLPARTGSRVARGVGDLLERGLCRSFTQFAQGAALQPPIPPLAEADRCAARIVERGWL